MDFKGMIVFVVVVWLWAILNPSVALVLEGEEAPCLTTASNNYEDALEKAILFFEGQRSGKLPSGQRVQWRGDSALSDGQLDNVTLTGGYYDAGDNVKFGWPMSFSICLLNWAAVEYKAQLNSAGQFGHLLSAIRWGTDFILKAHTLSTTLYTQFHINPMQHNNDFIIGLKNLIWEAGHLPTNIRLMMPKMCIYREAYRNARDGNSDHQCWQRPEDMDIPRTLYKISSTSPGTEAAADAAAALASAYMVFRDTQSKYSARLLEKSRSLFDLANKYRGSYKDSCPFYCSNSGYQDELLWAAAWLFKATNETQYLNFLLNNQGWSQATSEFSWDFKFIGAQTLIAKEHVAGNEKMAKYKNDADSFVCSLMPGSSSVQIQTTPGGLLYTRDAANLQYATSASLVLLFYSKTLQSASISGVQCGTRKFSTTQIRKFARSQVDYILGKNPLSYSYMVGFGDKYPKHVHHRGASIPSIKVHPSKVGCKDGFSSWFSTNDPNPNTHVGAIVGGPDSNDHFNDVRSDSNHLEPTTYINAAFVGAVAALLTEEDCFQLQLTKGISTI